MTKTGHIFLAMIYTGDDVRRSWSRNGKQDETCVDYRCSEWDDFRLQRHRRISNEVKCAHQCVDEVQLS